MAPRLELWTAGAGIPTSTARRAARLEAEGWDGLGLVDSQNLAADPFIELGLAAAATSTLQLGTAVTNPVTRHPAAMATAIATIQAESSGRAVLGIGRGDSALAHLGLSPAPVRAFERYLTMVQGYLRGDDVAFELSMSAAQGVASSDELHMAGGPPASRIHWLPRSLAKVPVDVAATGPKVIALAARLAERVTFAVGADADRLRWGIETATRAATEAGRDQGEIDFGGYVPVLVHPDRATARRLISGAVASYARFSVMHGTVSGPVDDAQRQSLERVHGSYDMGAHFTHDSPQSKALTDDVIDTFGIAGPAAYCVERLTELAELGLRRVFVMGGGIGLDRDEARAAHRRFVDEVLVALR